MTLDVGTNLFTLGLLYILLPVIIGAILLAGVYFAFKYFVSGSFPVEKNWLIVIVCFVLILLLITAAG